MTRRVESRAGCAKRIPPKCQDCGSGSPRVLSIAFEANGLTLYRHEWVCAECEWKRLHPDAEPRPKLPNERRPLPLQKETLF